MGTRDRIVAHLALVAEIADGTGMASTRLAAAVGYPGSSVAFAQLLSGMERDGLISREVRGKRTYRIALSPPAGRRPVGPAGAGPANTGPANTGPANTGPVNTGPGSQGPHAGTGPSGSGGAGAGYSGAGAGHSGAGKQADGPPPALPVPFPGTVDYDNLADQVIIRLLRRIAELNPAELATLERLLAPGQRRPAEELKIV